MRNYYEIRLSGSGGQGLGLAGRVLSQAAMLGGYDVCQTQSYGPEARGGSSRTDVIISRKEILYPNCRDLDILLAMNQESADRFSSDVKDGGMILVDSTFVDQLPAGKVYEYPLTQIAIDRFGTPLVANLIAVGMMASLSRLFALDVWVRTIRQTVPKRFVDLNLEAFEHGHREGREILHVEEGRVPVPYDRKQPVPECLKREERQ